MSDKSAEEMVGVKSAEEWNRIWKSATLVPNNGLVMDDHRVGIIKQIQLDAYRAGMVRASDHFLACLERLQHRPFTIDWTDAIKEVRTAARKVGGE